jgi:hypothetical protein
MGVLSQTAAAVHPTAGVTNTFEQKFAGEAVTAGMPLYLKASDDKYYKADSDDAAKDDVRGIAVCDAAINQAVVIQLTGQIDLGGGLTKGEVYVPGSTAGQVQLNTDWGSGDYMTILGVAIATDNLLLALTTTGVAHG